MTPRRRVAVSTALVGALSGLLLLPASPAPAVNVNQYYPRPSSGTYVVDGHGYGHGHGMSQHGAQGAAIAGLNHQEILAFYYPGSELGVLKGKIRILISADTTPDLVVLARTGLKLRDRGSKTTYPLPTNLGASRWRVVVTEANENAVEYFAGNTWTRWRPGGAQTLSGEGEFVGGGPISLVLPAGTVRRYRGTLRAAVPRAGSSDRDTVNIVGLNGYLRGVVPREIPASWRPQAVQAQSVAARTYAAWTRAQYKTRYYQICDTTSCQVYGGVEDEHPDSNAAISATTGEILTYDGKPAFTQFSASSGGFTSAGSMPYLVAKKDPYDGWSGNTSHNWSVKLAASKIRQAYPGIGTLRGVRVTSRDGNGQWKGRVLKVVLDGTKKDVTLSGDDFRFKFGLKSTWFALR